jgi:uncharacterized protein (DUF305 family)
MAPSPPQEVAMTFKALLAAAVMMAAPGAAFANHATSAEEAFKEANDTMMHSMMKPMTGDPDKDFIMMMMMMMMMMMAHHQGAIDMAKVELEYGKDPTLRALAEAIIEAQEKEIEEMQAWLAAHP